jgi:hypothetical protein
MSNDSGQLPRPQGGVMTDGEWEKLYQAAILETDWSKMQERIQATDLAIKGRLYKF